MRPPHLVEGGFDLPPNASLCSVPALLECHRLLRRFCERAIAVSFHQLASVLLDFRSI